MKVRRGFVSNSSSCSFVAIGVKTNKISDEEKIKIMNENNFDLNNYKIYDDDDKESQEYDIREAWAEFVYKNLQSHGIRIYSGSEDGVPNDTEYISKELATMDGYSTNSAQYTMQKLTEIGEFIKQKLKIDGEIELISGTRMC